MRSQKYMLQSLTGIVLSLLVSVMFLYQCSESSLKVRNIELFSDEWKFHSGDIKNAQNPDFNDADWRILDLPHDWSIEGTFSNDHPATPGGGALPGGIGWYRKVFNMPENKKNKLVFIDFDGIYQNSEIWINGNYLGKRPNGYISFRVELTPYLSFGDTKNVIAVKVDNSDQPNSRWYSGSGIYRNVRLVTTEKILVDHWGTFITTPEVSKQSAKILIKTNIRSKYRESKHIILKTWIVNAQRKKIAVVQTGKQIIKDSVNQVLQEIIIKNPELWSVENPCLYKAVSQVELEGIILDDYETTFGIRYFSFDIREGFFLNGKKLKIKGVCNHHDLGCLGSAVNYRAIERQLEILKDMGCNSIRTSHNPPAPELLDLCDRMGFIVMDEAFDMWKKNKTKFDYHLFWDEWHRRDLEDFVHRDKNHPSVFIWSIGNEIIEQWDSTGISMAKELTAIVKNIDPTRPVTSGCNESSPSNYIIQSGALDLLGFNYHHEEYIDFHKSYPGQKLIASETNSALASRGYYNMPSDSVRIWPVRWDIPFSGNPDYACSAYDNCRTPWGSTHNDTWKLVKKYDFVSGMYIWTGFDYLGEPTPYSWPARSSYFGLVDLAGFPKDSYYFYQSEWMDEPVLHIFPHWNWKEGDLIDIWAYTNCEEVELFLNDTSMGSKKRSEDNLYLVWHLSYTPGILKAIGRLNDGKLLIKTIQTAGKPAKIVLQPDRDIITCDGNDLSFITVKIVDEKDVLVPYADNLIKFDISGEGTIEGVDNGNQTSHEPFKANYRKAYNGLCLAVVKAGGKAGTITLKAVSDGLEQAEIILMVKIPDAI